MRLFNGLQAIGIKNFSLPLTPRRWIPIAPLSRSPCSLPVAGRSARPVVFDQQKYTKGSPRSQGFVRCNLRRVGKDHALPTSWRRLSKNSELAGKTRLSMMRGCAARPNLGRPATASKASAGNRRRPTVRWFGASKQPAEQSHRQVQEQRDQRDRGDRRGKRQKGYERRAAKFGRGDDEVP